MRNCHSRVYFHTPPGKIEENWGIVEILWCLRFCVEATKVISTSNVFQCSAFLVRCFTSHLVLWMLKSPCRIQCVACCCNRLFSFFSLIRTCSRVYYEQILIVMRKVTLTLIACGSVLGLILLWVKSFLIRIETPLEALPPVLCVIRCFCFCFFILMSSFALRNVWWWRIVVCQQYEQFILIGFDLTAVPLTYSVDQNWALRPNYSVVYFLGFYE